MVLPCIVCGVDVETCDAKNLPAPNTAKRLDYCRAWGISIESLPTGTTRRYICFSHFDDEDFEIKRGKKVLKRDAYPKELSEEERQIMLDNIVKRYRNPREASTNVQSDRTPPQSQSLPQPSSSESLPSTFDHNFEHFEIPDSEEIIEKAEKKRPKYVIVDYDNLLQYLKRCPKCGHHPKNAEPTVMFFGSALKSEIYCASCNEYVTWESQKRIVGRKYYEGNVEISAAMASTPIPLASFLQFALILNLAIFSKTTYHTIIPTFWKVVNNAYDEMQENVYNFLKDKVAKKIPINLCADGQFDSRGFSALMCCVTIMDAVSRLVVTTIALHKNEENCPSTSLECRGVEKGLNEILQKQIPIATLTTDRSKTVISLMESRFPFIRHMYDAWHVIKGVAKILRLESKKVRATRFKEWCQGLLNHLWYGVASANGDGALCQQYAVSSLLHAMGIHSWHSDIMSEVLHDSQSIVLNTDPDDFFPNDPLDLPGTNIHKLKFDQHLSCGHGQPYDSDKTPLDPQSKSYAVLQKTFTSDNFLNDVNQLSPQFATSALEGFQGLVSNKYRSKNSYYKKKGFENRTKLAVLHYNHNRFDEMEGKRIVIEEYQRAAKHRGGDMVTKKRKTATDYSWKSELVKNTVKSFINNNDDDETSDGESEYNDEIKSNFDESDVDNLMESENEDNNNGENDDHDTVDNNYNGF